MMINKLVLTAMVYLSTSHFITAPPVEQLISPGVSISRVNDSKPGIESILYNDNIQKKQKARKVIQATGFREGDEKHFVVHFLKNQLHGEWQSFYNAKQPCDSGSFVKNLPDGEWKTWYKNGQLKTVRNYSAKKLKYIRADIKRNHPKDQRYEITRSAATDLNFNRHFMPVYETDKIQSNLPLLERIKLNTSDEQGNYIAPFKECLHHGAFINYYQNGRVKDSGHYVNGLKHDLWTESGSDGDQRAFGFYKHGVKEGQWKYYNSKEELVYTEVYRHGKKTSVHYFRD
jgi:antitoxin component YwqK of YwqJK toxin-antitoxin module